MKRVAMFLVLAAGLLMARPSAASPAAVPTVNTVSISDDPTDGKCDLYEAMSAVADYDHANDSDHDGSLTTYHECSTGAAPHVILFTGAAAGGTVTLPLNLYNRPFTGLPYVTGNLSLTGPVVIDGGGAAVNAHIFITNVGGHLTLTNLVVQNGYTTGGGGAILGLGGDDVINIANSSFTGNIAENDGGAINAVGTVNIFASNFSGNKALGKDSPSTDYPGRGGALYLSGYNSFSISLSNFAANFAGEGGGAIASATASGQIADSVFNGNLVNDNAVDANTTGGGAIYNYGNNPDAGLTLTRVAINGNLTFDADGGAIYNGSGGYLHVVDSSFNGNIAGDLTPHVQLGGAIYNQAYLDIRRVMFLANVSAKGNGGAVANDRTGQAYFGNVTLTGNGAPYGSGGAIWNGNTQMGGPASDVFLYNVTLSKDVSPNKGAEIFNETGASHEVTLANTIIDGLPLGGDVCNTTLTSAGYNVEGSDKCGLHQLTDHPGGSIGLDTPAFNGGPLTSLLTEALTPPNLLGMGNDAIDRGSNAVCANAYVQNVDARSVPRPLGLTCDMGAFESPPQVAGYGSLPVPPGPIDLGNTSQGTPVTHLFTVLDVGNVTLTLDHPEIVGPDASEFAVDTPFSIDIDTQASIQLRCLATATGDFSATLTFTTNVPSLPIVTYLLSCHVNPAPTPGYGSSPIAPGTLDYGQVQVGVSSARPLQYFETGNAPLTISAATVSDPAEFSVGVFDHTINDGEAPVTINVTCTPSGFGVRLGTLTITSNDPVHPTSVYNLVCEGVAPPPAPLAAPGHSYIDGQAGLTTLGGAYDVAISPDGLNAYVTSFNDNTLTVFDRDTVTGQLTFSMSATDPDMLGPAMVEVSPDGTRVFVTAITSDAFLVFRRDLGTGTVGASPSHKFINGQAGVTGLDYPYGIAVAPDGRFIYVTGYLGNSVVTFSRNQTGTVNYQSTLVANVRLLNPYIPVISPDGQNLYVTGGHTGLNPSPGYVTTYKRSVLDGSLVFSQHLSSGLGGAWGIAVSPDGANVYVAAYYDNDVVRLSRDPISGTLTYDGVVANAAAVSSPDSGPQQPATPDSLGLVGALDVKVSPNGLFVYATGFTSDALSVFGRDTSSGSLSSVQVITRGAGLPALDGAREIAVSPDGTTVYATGSNDNAVVALHAANPIPTLSDLLPASAAQGAAGLVVKVQGTNFVPGSSVQVGGSDRATSYVTVNEVDATLVAGDLTAAGPKTVTVFNPTPGGGFALNVLTFTVSAPSANPLPSIDWLTPQGASAGDAALTLAVHGANFVNGATIRFNGVNRATTFVSGAELHMTVTAADLQTPGPAVVTVFNPIPGGGLSNAVTFDVAPPGQNPVPTITLLNPQSASIRGAASSPIVVRVLGQHFVPGAQGQWNGQDRPTQYISLTEVRVTLNGLEIAFGPSGAIEVVNPGPGGGASNPANFIIYPYGLYLPLTRR